jgi:hypothetical protein
MMGGFFVRFVRYLSAEEFAKLLQLARARTFKVIKGNSDATVIWMLVGRHWVVAVSIGFRTTGDTHHISFCPPELVEEGNKLCMKQEERKLEPEWLFWNWGCHHIDVSILQKDENGYDYEIHYTCYEIERKAVFGVEINTTQPEQHDDFVLQLVAEELTSESPRTVFRPM